MDPMEALQQISKVLAQVKPEKPKEAPLRPEQDQRGEERKQYQEKYEAQDQQIREIFMDRLFLPATGAAEDIGSINRIKILVMALRAVGLTCSLRSAKDFVQQNVAAIPEQNE